MVAYWQEQEVSLSAHFETVKLRRLTAAHVSDYQRARLEAGRAPKTINGAVSVLRQILTHARLWYRFAEDYKPVRNSRPSVGRALSLDELKRLFETAALWKSEAPTLIKVGKDGKTYKLRADWQYALGIVDPTRPMAGWRTAWRSILKESGISARFHDLRHTAITTMTEAGLPDHTIMAQVGHISPDMLKHYSHTRRQALNQCAAALQPHYPTAPEPLEMVN